MLAHELLGVTESLEMVRSEPIKRRNLFNEINVRRANQQGELRS